MSRLLLVVLGGCGYGADIFPPAPAGVTVATCPMPTLDLMYPFSTAPAPTAAFPDAPACAIGQYDAIIVLGCPSNEEAEEGAACQNRRVQRALALHEAGYGDSFSVTGASVHSEGIEAEALGALLLAAGIDESAIYLEPLAEHTDENIYYSSLIMEEQGWEVAIVVSSVDHLLYAAACDANCCVRKGRLSTLSFPVGGGGTIQAAHYALTPPAQVVAEWECAHLENPSKGMCTHLDARESCAE